MSTLTEAQIYDKSGSFIIKKKPVNISKFIIRKSVILETKTRLLESGVYFENGRVFWSGTISGDTAKIEKVTSPKIVSNSLNSKLSDKGIEDICEAVKKPNEFLFAQVYGHSGRAFDLNIDHNEVIRFEKGFISIGVPYYGANLDKLENCEVYEYNGDSEWARMNNSDVSRRFLISI